MLFKRPVKIQKGLICLLEDACIFPPYLQNTHGNFDEVSGVFTCDSGFRFSDLTLTKTVTCEDGQWQLLTDRCQG